MYFTVHNNIDTVKQRWLRHIHNVSDKFCFHSSWTFMAFNKHISLYPSRVFANIQNPFSTLKYSCFLNNQISFYTSWAECCTGSWWVLPLLRSRQLLSVDSREIIKAKSPLAIPQSLGSFGGLMLAPEGGIWAGPRSVRVKPHSLTPYRDYYPPGCSQCSAQHLIDINSPPPTIQIHTHRCLIPFRLGDDATNQQSPVFSLSLCRCG